MDMLEKPIYAKQLSCLYRFLILYFDLLICYLNNIDSPSITNSICFLIFRMR